MSALLKESDGPCRATDESAEGTEAKPLRRVLVVTGDAFQLASLTHRLAASGYRAVGVADGYQAVAMLEIMTFDCLVTAIGLPGKLTGHMLAAMTWRRWPAVKVVAVAESSGLLVTSAVINSDGTWLPVLTTPFTTGALLEALGAEDTAKDPSQPE